MDLWIEFYFALSEKWAVGVMGCRSNGLSIYPSSYFIWFFPKKLFWFWILKKKNWLDRREKNYSDLTFSQYNHIQNFEEKKLFQHFANLIKIKSIFYLFFLVARVLLHERPKKKIENREQVCRSNYIPAPRRGRGVYCFTSVRPSFKDIFRRIFLSNYWWQKSYIWSQASYRYLISWGAFLDLSDSYFLFADLVVFIHIEHTCTFFSTTIDGRNLVFGHKLHIGTPYHGNWQGHHKWALAHSSLCFN